MKHFSNLLVACIATTAAASPRIDSNSIADRHDLLLQKDSGTVSSPVLTWPWPLGRTLPETDQQINDSSFPAAAERYRATYHEAGKLGFKPTYASVAIATDKLPFRSYGYQPREQFELNVSKSWLSEWFSGNLSLTYADNPSDGDEFRLDGSYLACALGNWSLALDQVDRWWGPGWDGSLILSNNARPVPAVSLTRISPDAFETKWLNWIGPWTFTTFMGQMDNQEPENDEGVAVGSDALLFGMRIDFSPFGWDNLDIGLTRTAHWAGEGRPDGLDTFWKLLTGEDNAVPGSGITRENEPGNQLAGVDYRLRIPGINFAQYGQVIGEDEETFLPDACMILFGGETWGELNALNATWRVYYEWADTRAGYLRRDSRPNRDFNTAYNHSIYKTGYRRHNQSIGHAMDGDGVMRSIGTFLVMDNGNLWGAKYRNYSLNRDGRGPNSVTIDPIEGQSFELFAELQLSNFEIFKSSNYKILSGLAYIDEENQATGESDDEVTTYLSLSTSY